MQAPQRIRPSKGESAEASCKETRTIAELIHWQWRVVEIGTKFLDEVKCYTSAHGG